MHALRLLTQTASKLSPVAPLAIGFDGWARMRKAKARARRRYLALPRAPIVPAARGS
ncbi:unnamed protein product [Amoebophrya sp. A120]|nr:unnamed protein product [Amoebophrya sp. A120]|eukprot:GSA120T00015848001.1